METCFCDGHSRGILSRWWSGGNEVGTALLDPGLKDGAHKDPEREFLPNLALLSFPATTQYLLTALTTQNIYIFALSRVQVHLHISTTRIPN